MAATRYESVACDGERFIFPKEFPYKYNRPYNPCIGMSSEEMSRFVMHLMGQLDAIREELKRANETISSNMVEQQRLNVLVLSLTKQLHDAQVNAELSRIIVDLQSSVRVSNNHGLRKRVVLMVNDAQ